ncbi:MAG: hypothetical protein GAK30_00725 [Paracidovorax wautersii]|uniref:Excinuclease ATPase subunit n=1 Tax=Paracidovorax wautersii TaxID=1177982 RepID=A0A7V8FR49_9BURK|nr:MAG: hypothetical protein GAK30_00725 [Paracidovorax wautersii]
MNIRQTRAAAGALLLGLCAMGAHAADRTVYLPFAPEVEAALAAGRIDGSVKFALAGTGSPGQVIRADVVTNKKTNAFAKSDANACSWAMQSALIQLHEAAKEAGASRVVNIVSFYKRNEFRSTTDFECHAGAVVAGVALKADLSK